MRITAIKPDGEGNKMIAFQRVLDRQQAKPWYSTVSFAVFFPANNVLTIYKGQEYYFLYLKNYKEALKYILSL